MRMLASYLRSDPNLRSIVLDGNAFSDDGLNRLTVELQRNTKLAHLSIRGCTNTTNAGLQKLCDVLSTTNTCLFQVDLDVEHFDRDLAREVITESALNRALQEKLRPVRVVTTLGPSGEVIKVVTGAERDELLAAESDSDRERDEDEASVNSEPEPVLSQERSITTPGLDTTDATGQPRMHSKFSRATEGSQKFLQSS